jgi:hypothetical protein
MRVKFALSTSLQAFLDAALDAQNRAIALRERELDYLERRVSLKPSLVIERVAVMTAEGTANLIGEIEMVQLKEGQEFRATARPKSRRGTATHVQEGSVTWETSDPAVVLVEEDSGNELSARIIAQGPGSAVVTLKADADLGDGVKEITGVVAVVVAPGDAVVFELEEGAIIETPESGSIGGPGEPGSTEPPVTGTTEPSPDTSGNASPAGVDTGLPVESSVETPVETGEKTEGEKSVDEMPQPFMP